MRAFHVALLLLAVVASRVHADETKSLNREIDKQIFDVLKEVHNRGADLFNAGDTAGCNRIFQGSLLTVRAVLTHRPAEQKFIEDMLADAEREQSTSRRAFALHESIEKLRARLRAAPNESKGLDPERLDLPPRELKTDAPAKKNAEEPERRDPKTDPKTDKPEPPKLLLPNDGVMGRLFWQGRPLPGAQIKFVSTSADQAIIEGRSDAAGRYQVEKVPPGKYTVLLTISGADKPVLPDRYATTTTSPLTIEVKGGGDTLDFLLK